MQLNLSANMIIVSIYIENQRSGEFMLNHYGFIFLLETYNFISKVVNEQINPPFRNSD